MKSIYFQCPQCQVRTDKNDNQCWRCKYTLEDNWRYGKGKASHGEFCRLENYDMPCPYCGKNIYYWSCYHGCKVWFDHKGDPWPKHACYHSPFKTHQLIRPYHFITKVVEIHEANQVSILNFEKYVNENSYKYISEISHDGLIWEARFTSQREHGKGFLLLEDYKQEHPKSGRIRLIAETDELLAPMMLYKPIRIKRVRQFTNWNLRESYNNPQNLTYKSSDVLELILNDRYQEVINCFNKSKKLYDDTDENGMTYLHWAVWNGSFKCTEYLLSSGMNYDKVDSKNQTPLHFAAEIGDEELVKLLLDYGAGVLAENRAGKRPYHIAIENGHEKIADMLSEVGGDLVGTNEEVIYD